MARTIASQTPLSAVIQRNGLQVFNDAYVRNGRGTRGIQAAMNAIRRLFPGVGQQTLQALSRAAQQARDTANRQKRAGDRYTTPADKHTETQCGRRTPEGTARRRIFQYTVIVPIEYMNNDGVVFAQTSNYTLEFSKPPTLGTIMSQASQAATAEARFKLGSPGMKARGISDFNVGTPQITGSFTCLT